MADTTNQKILNTRIRLKYDSYENWTTNNPTLLAGEVALVYIPEDKVTQVGEHNLNGTKPPHVLMKVGDGTSGFNSLKYVSALAADVNSYAKMKSADFEAQVKSLANAQVSDSIKANADAIDALEALVGTESVTTQIANAIAALNLANTYVAKENGKSLVSDTEIAKLTTVSEGANKVEASTNGKIKIDGVDTTVYTHPDNHTIAEVDGLQTALDGKSNIGHKHVSTDITDLDTTIKGYDYATKTEAKGYADAKDGAIEAAQKKADDITTYVGTFTASEGVNTVVKYIDAKTANIASDERVNSLENRIKAVENDYLVEADKTELSTAINNEKQRAEGVEGGLRTDVDAIKGDYLKTADKTALEGKITAEETRAKSVEEGLQNQINIIMNNPDAEGAINSINEFTKYVEDHGEIAEGFRTDINKNKEDIAAINNADTGILKKAQDYADGLDTAMDTRVKVLEGINHDAYIAADAALKSELEGEINAIDNHSHDNKTVLDGITDQNIIDWNQALDISDFAEGTENGTIRVSISDVKVHGLKELAFKDNTDTLKTTKGTAGLVDKMPLEGNTWENSDATTEQGAFYVQANEGKRIYLNPEKGTIVTSGSGDMYMGSVVKISDIADAIDKKHSHDNKTVLDGITDGKVTKWDALDTWKTGLATEVSKSDRGEHANIAVSVTTKDGVVTDVAVDDSGVAMSFIAKPGSLSNDEIMVAKNDGIICSGKKISDLATAEQGTKADTAVQTVTAGTGLKATRAENSNDVSIAIDDKVVFIFNCGTSDLENYNNITTVANDAGGHTAII